jgi:hypothetical protein
MMLMMINNVITTGIFSYHHSCYGLLCLSNHVACDVHGILNSACVTTKLDSPIWQVLVKTRCKEPRSTFSCKSKGKRFSSELSMVFTHSLNKNLSIYQIPWKNVIKILKIHGPEKPKYEAHKQEICGVFFHISLPYMVRVTQICVFCM